MTYIVVSENEIVKSEMERPDRNIYDENGNLFWTWEDYLLSLPRIPAPGHKWEMWQSVVEGKDFELKQRKQPSPFCRDCADAEVLGICDYDGFPCNGSAIAIPIQPTPEGEKEVVQDLLASLNEAIECITEMPTYPKATQLMGKWLKAIKKANLLNNDNKK